MSWIDLQGLKSEKQRNTWHLLDGFGINGMKSTTESSFNQSWLSRGNCSASFVDKKPGGTREAKLWPEWEAASPSKLICSDNPEKRGSIRSAPAVLSGGQYVSTLLPTDFGESYLITATSQYGQWHAANVAPRTNRKPRDGTTGSIKSDWSTWMNIPSGVSG